MDKTGASAKHLDFHLQREKALTKDLEAKCKALQAQIAQLEQDKAELRREKIALSDEIKRSSKLDERVHFLQKENDHKDELLEAEKVKVADALAETERIRSKASTSIAAWTEAERQWVAEQESLNAEIAELHARVAQLSDAHHALRETHDDVVRALQKKEQQCEKQGSTTVKLEADVAALHAQLEKSQNKVFDLEQTIYRLDLAGVKQKEALSLKDTEINALEAKIAQHVLNEEKLEQAISSLSDRVNAAKMMDLQGKGEKEKLFCDFSDSQKEIQRLTLQIDALRRDAALSAQTQNNLQAVVDELRAKCTTQLEEIKDRSVQIRKDELTISQLQMELNKCQSQNGEWDFRFSSLQGELRESQAHCHKLSAQHEEDQATARKLQAENQALQVQIDAKEEAVVVASADAADKMDTLRQDVANLEREVQARQAMIRELTSQLTEANERNSSYHSKILEEADTSARVREFISGLQQDVFHANQRLLLSQCVEQKYELCLAQSEHMALSLSCLFGRHWSDQRARDLGRIDDFQNDVARLELALHEARNDVETRSDLLASAEARIAELVVVLGEKESALQEQTDSSAAVCATVASQEQAIEEMRVLLHDAEVDRNALTAQMKNLQDAHGQLQRHTVRHDALSACFHTWLFDAQETMTAICLSKNELLSDACTALTRAVTKTAEQSVAHQEAAERRCRELENFIKETKTAVLQKDVALAEKESIQEEKIAALQRTTHALEKEKSQISFQLNSLLTRFEAERAAADELRTSLAAQTAASASARETLEREVAKLRKGVEYELKRKGEYKDALEKLRALRDESESLRAKEKSLSADAIAEANAEASYWIDAFDRLKRMIDNTKRGSDQSAPTIDAETVLRLENAKSKIFGPIRDQDVNSGHPCPVMKRRRVDTD